MTRRIELTKKIKSSKTWDHDKHDSKKSESCDVCNGRLTKEELADARIEREKRRKERSKSSSRHKNDSSSRSSKDSKSRSHRSHSKEKERSKSDKEKILQEEEEEEEKRVKPEDIEKKVEEILASSGVHAILKSQASTRCEIHIWVFSSFSFPQNERKIY